MTSSGLSLPSTSPFFALRRVQASTSRANERRRIHSTFPAMFGPLLRANAEACAERWECKKLRLHFLPCSALFCVQTLRRVPRGGSVKNYVCISCQTYTFALLSLGRSSEHARSRLPCRGPTPLRPPGAFPWDAWLAGPLRRLCARVGHWTARRPG